MFDRTTYRARIAPFAFAISIFLAPQLIAGTEEAASAFDSVGPAAVGHVGGALEAPPFDGSNPMVDLLGAASTDCASRPVADAHHHVPTENQSVAKPTVVALTTSEPRQNCHQHTAR